MTYQGYEITAYYKLWTRWQIDDTGLPVKLLDAENPQASPGRVSYDVRRDDAVLDGLETLKSVEHAIAAMRVIHCSESENSRPFLPGVST